MINTEVIGYPVLVNREFVYCGLHKEGDIIKYNFSPAHRRLMETGAISEFEQEKYEHKCVRREGITIAGKKYEYGEKVDITSLDVKEIEVFIKQRFILRDLKEEFKPTVIKKTQIDAPKSIIPDVSEIKDDIMGITFKQLCEEYKLDVEEFCKKLDIKKVGLHLRKVNEENIESVLAVL